METERIPRDWVKTRKGLDLTLVTSVRDIWNIPEEPIATLLVPFPFSTQPFPYNCEEVFA